VNKKIFLLLSIFAAVSSAAIAQTNTPKPVAIRWIVGETGNTDKVAERPRIVHSGPVESAVRSSVAFNIMSAERRAFDMINQKRVEAGLKPVVWSDKLEAIARSHSADMANQDYFAHRSLAGKMVSDRADDAHLGGWRSIGENIAVNRGYDDPIAKAVEGWMNSPSHKHNLLTDSWKESAVGVAVSANGSYYFTQVFLKR